MRLNEEGVRLPYDRGLVRPGIVHLGVGAFFRAHLAAYTDALLGDAPEWGIVGASLRRPDMREALAPQGFLYTLAERGAAGTRMRPIGALLDVIDAARDPAPLLAAMADPMVRIVSLTVTEKGYCCDPATGALDPNHPDILHDLAHPEAPLSAPGLILRALEMRRAAGVPPFAVLSCDNLPANGRLTAGVVAALAARRDEGLAAHVREDVAFPSTMVDRIVPATTDEDRAAVAAATGFEDAWPVVAEPFTQWVIEDRFPQGRPDWAAAGAELVSDVEPYELMKLRMLNGAHSTLAYLGYLAGHETVAEAIAAPELRALVRGLMLEEAAPTLPAALGDVTPYAESLLERFANPALRHRTWQIAMDGSRKLPQRLLGALRSRRAAGLPAPRLTLGIAAWMRYVSGTDERGAPIDVQDPLADRFRAIAAEADGAPEALAAGLLAVEEVFGRDLREDASLRAELSARLGELFRHGAAETARRLTASL